MKLKAYIEKEKLDYLKKREEEEQKKKKERKDKEVYRIKFIQKVIQQISSKLHKVSLDIQEMSIEELDPIFEEYPFTISFKINIIIIDNTVRYYLTIVGNPKIDEESVILKLESIENKKELNVEKLNFNEIENLNFDEYLTFLFQKIKNI